MPLPFGAMTHKKGLPDENLRNKLYAIMDERTSSFNCAGIESILKAMESSIGVNVANHIAVDPDIFKMKGVMRKSVTEPDEDELEIEVQKVADLVSWRDTPIASIDPGDQVSGGRGLYELSWFLQTREIQRYSSTDYLATQPNLDRVLGGETPNETLLLGSIGTISTGRDLAALVHKDNPLSEAMTVIDTLISNDVEWRVPDGYIQNSRMQRFTSYGNLWIHGRLGALLSSVGIESFVNKWTLRIARPEELGPAYGIGIIPQCFPEGSPMHPSMNAMHFYAYHALASWIEYVFDENHILPSGNDVKHELDLWAANFSDGRVWAGVHTLMDNWPYESAAREMGSKAAMQDLRIINNSF